MFLVVPVVHVPFGAVEALFRAVGQGSLGWLLAGGAERLRPRDAHAILGRIDQAVLAGDSVGGDTIAGNTVAGGTVAGSTVAGSEPALTGDSTLRIAERAARYGTWLPTGPPPSGVTGQAGRAGRVWVGTPLRVVRGLDRATIDLRNDLTYDGLLVSDRG